MAIVEPTSPGSAADSKDRRRNPPLITPTLLCVFVTMYLPLCNFYLLLSTLPALVSSNGAGDIGAGLTTGTLMAATVISEIVVPQWVPRFGYRRLTQVALLLLALPTLALCISYNLSLALLVSAVRGVALGITFVIGTAVVAHVTAPSRRAEGLALFGVLTGTAAIVGAPAGVWIAARGGPILLIGISTLLALGGLITVNRIPDVVVGACASDRRLNLQSARTLLPPALAFALTAIAAAIFMTFAPLIGAPSAANVVPVALLVHSCSTLFGRWASGRLTYPPPYLMCAAGMLAGAGLITISFSSQLPSFFVGAALTGLAFGAAQNVSLVWMFERAPPAQYDSVSAIWNIAYDGGLGLGAAIFGFVLTILGQQSAFILTGASLIIAAAGLPFAFRKFEDTDSNIALDSRHATSGEATAADGCRTSKSMIGKKGAEYR